MSNYLVINLADRSNMGAISSLSNGVTAKRTRTGLSALLKGQNNIETVDAFAMLDDDLLGNLSRSDLRMQALRQKCLQSKKIYLATHGTPTDVDHAFAAAAGGTPLCTAKQLAQFMLAALPKRDKPYNIALVMCYGARTLTYRTAQLDHQGMIPITDLRTSFAYKFYRALIVHRKVRMTARTGAVAYDNNTGVSTVEDELSIDARIDKENFLRQAHIVPAMTAWRGHRGLAAQAGNAQYDQFTRTTERFTNNPTHVPRNAREVDIKAYADVMRMKKAYQDIMDANTDRTKYGKLVYTYQSGQLKIVNKYGNGGRPLTLYNGLLV